MKPFYRIILSLLLACIICQLAFLIASREAGKCEHEKMDELFVRPTAYNCLLLGSSSIHYFINPAIFDRVTGLHSINSGIDGANLFEVNMILNAYLLVHPAPEYIVLTLDLGSFNLGQKIKTSMPYRPYLSNTILEKTLEKAAPIPWRFRLLPFLHFTDDEYPILADALKGLLENQQKLGHEFQYKGYSTNTLLEMSNADTITRFMSQPVDEEGVQLLEHIIDLCNSKNIKLLLTSAPEYNKNYQRHVLDSKEIFKKITHIASTRQLDFVREDTLRLCEHREFFRNTEHLNTSGAAYYSIIIGNQVRKKLNIGSTNQDGVKKR